jgi:glycosyltransferase involved in cell wall biosynthesis
VVDDGSTDGTAEIIHDLVQSAPDGVALKYFHKPNGGANSARNRGLIESNGEFICFLDSDDWLLPDSVKTRARILIEDPAVDFCYGLCAVQDDGGKEMRRMNSPWPEPGQARIAPYLFHTNAPLIRRSVCACAGLWREDDTHGQEYEYFARIKGASERVVFIDQVLSVYMRHHNENIFDLSDREFVLAIYRMLWAIKSLVIFSRHDSRQERGVLADEFHKIAKCLYRLRDYSTACMALRESLLLAWTFRRFMQLGCITAFMLCCKRQGTGRRAGRG